MAITEELSALRASTLADIEAAETSAQLGRSAWRCSKSGTLTGYLRSMGQVPKEERAAVGKAVNGRVSPSRSARGGQGESSMRLSSRRRSTRRLST